MKVQEIREIIKLINQTTINEFEFEQEGTKIKIIKSTGLENSMQPTDAPVPAPAVQSVSKQEVQSESIEEKPPVVGEKTEQPSNLHKITSPMVGTFYGASSPDEDPYIKIGEKVKKDTIVCIVEAMKLFNEIEAEVSGEIVEVLVEDGQLIEYGQPLFLVKAE